MQRQHQLWKTRLVVFCSTWSSWISNLSKIKLVALSYLREFTQDPLQKHSKFLTAEWCVARSYKTALAGDNQDSDISKTPGLAESGTAACNLLGSLFPGKLAAPPSHSNSISQAASTRKTATTRIQKNALNQVRPTFRRTLYELSSSCWLKSLSKNVLQCIGPSILLVL